MECLRCEGVGSCIDLKLDEPTGEAEEIDVTCLDCEGTGQFIPDPPSEPYEVTEDEEDLT